jgi:hypothetical protein
MGLKEKLGMDLKEHHNNIWRSSKLDLKWSNINWWLKKSKNLRGSNSKEGVVLWERENVKGLNNQGRGVFWERKKISKNISKEGACEREKNMNQKIKRRGLWKRKIWREKLMGKH